jgi:tetratricopeptide (TPR) repeat protein
LKLNPNLVNAYYNRALQYDKFKNYQAAIADYSAFIKTRRDFEMAFLFRGNDYFFTGNYEAAVADFNSVIALNPKNTDAYYNKGVCLVQLHRLAEACPEFEKALQLGHASAQAMLNQYCKK